MNTLYALDRKVEGKGRERGREKNRGDGGWGEVKGGNEEGEELVVGKRLSEQKLVLLTSTLMKSVL